MTDKEILKKQVRKYGNMLKLNKTDVELYKNYAESTIELYNYIADELRENREIKREEIPVIYKEEIELIENTFKTLESGIKDFDDSDLLFYTGNLYASMGNILQSFEMMDKAIEIYEKITEIDKDSYSVYSNLAMAYEQSFEFSKNEEKGVVFITKILKNYKKFIKFDVDDYKYYLSYAEAIFALFKFIKDEKTIEKTANRLIDLYKKSKELSPEEHYIYLKFGIIFHSITEKITSLTLKKKVSKLAVDILNKAEEFDEEENPLLSLNLNFAISDYYDANKEKNREKTELEQSVHVMQMSLTMMAFGRDINYNIREDGLYYDAKEINGFKAFVILNEYVMILEQCEIPFDYKISVIYTFGKVILRLAKEPDNEYYADFLLEKALDYFERVSNSLYPDIYIQKASVLLQMSERKENKSEKIELLKKAQKIIQKTKEKDDFYESTFNKIKENLKSVEKLQK